MDKRNGILIICAAILVLSFVGTASARTWYVDDDGGADFIRIQDAINKAKDGDTILVYSGVYYENVVVDKSVTLKGIGYPIVDANGRGSAIRLTVDRITLEGFNATNSGWPGVGGIMVTSNSNTIKGNNVCKSWSDGIYLYSSSNNNISGNIANDNYLHGIRLRDSSNNSISGNIANDNGNGISIRGSSNNSISGNIANDNGNGISIGSSSDNDDDVVLDDSSSNNSITGNNVCDNWEGINIGSSNNNVIIGNTFVNCGLFVEFSYQNTVEDNTVNGKPLVYLEEASDYKVTDAGQIILVNCNNITVENLDLSNTSVGIKLWKTKDSKVLNNTASNNRYGIYLWYSSNNSISGNIFCDNGYGICLKDSSNNSISGNNASNNYDGISIGSYSDKDDGIVLGDSSSNNSISGNNVCNNKEGIRIWSSSNNIITGNNASNNYWEGIYLEYSSNYTITGNTFVNCGLFIEFSYQNTVEDNTVNGKPLVYLEDASNYKVTDAGQVILVNCNNITVEDLDLSNTSVGIELWRTKDSKVLNNTASNNNRKGIRLKDSSNNSISGNIASKTWDGISLRDSSNNSISGNIASNNWNGISIESSSNNNIHLNNLINNRYNVYSYKSTNIWNSSLEITYTYDGNVYTNYLGNYWDDYAEKYPDAKETDSTGIWDTPYGIAGDKDNYPLMMSFENYIISTSAPA